MWQRLSEWLHTHAPSTAQRLNPPAGEHLLQAYEAELGYALPSDLRDFWLQVDGMDLDGGWPPGYLIPPLYPPFSVAKSRNYRRMRLQVAGEHADDGELAAMSADPAGTTDSMPLWLPEWIPPAGEADGMFVDCRGGAMHGCVMEYFKYDGADGPVWPSVAAMLTDIADRLDRIDVTAVDTSPSADPRQGNWEFPWG
ncbi:SMI1/KNR4 family protein [Actinoplanes sp. NPDC049316]|uniref:SMI1/KNR4 family protein n=1 Tax=Actinoplanes sp. NPDC049316 TaxID=3154727 RepID=UPI00344421C7